MNNGLSFEYSSLRELADALGSITGNYYNSDFSIHHRDNNDGFSMASVRANLLSKELSACNTLLSNQWEKEREILHKFHDKISENIRELMGSISRFIEESSANEETAYEASEESIQEAERILSAMGIE